MKKVITAAFCLCFVVFMIAGCTPAKTETPTEGPSEIQTEAPAEEAEAPAEEAEAPAEEAEAPAEEAEAPAEEAEAPAEEAEAPAEEAEAIEGALFAFNAVEGTVVVAVLEDGTLEMNAEGYGTIATGEWSYDKEAHAMSITLDGTEMEVTIDPSTHAMSFEVNMFDGQLIDTLSAPSESWGVLEQ